MAETMQYGQSWFNFSKMTSKHVVVTNSKSLTTLFRKDKYGGGGDDGEEGTIDKIK